MSNLSKKEGVNALGTKECVVDTHTDSSDKRGVEIPYFVHEAEVMRLEKHTKRLWIAVIVAIVCILASNAIWLWYINQYDFADYEYEQDGQGVNIIGDRNEVRANGAETEGED